MHILTSVSRFRNAAFDRVLAVGYFDGVHRGHQAVVRQALDDARDLDVQAWALTFDRHPLALLAPERRPPLLTPLPQRLECLAGLGLDGCLVMPFTAPTARLSPEAFIDRIRGRDHRLRAIFCGPNWHFGCRGRGDPVVLAALGRDRGFDVRVTPPVRYRGHPVSSTRIRRAIQSARLADAAAMLGRVHTIRETVVRGRGLGRQLGMATANLHPENEVLPPHGVYAVRARTADRCLEGVANLGVRPTFCTELAARPVLELHLFDFDGDLYGRTLDIGLVARLRDERRFDGPEALAVQVRRDIRTARRILNPPARSHTIAVAGHLDSG